MTSVPPTISRMIKLENKISHRLSRAELAYRREQFLERWSATDGPVRPTPNGGDRFYDCCSPEKPWIAARNDRGPPKPAQRRSWSSPASVGWAAITCLQWRPPQ